MDRTPLNDWKVVSGEGRFCPFSIGFLGVASRPPRLCDEYARMSTNGDPFWNPFGSTTASKSHPTGLTTAPQTPAEPPQECQEILWIDFGNVIWSKSLRA